MDALRRIWKDVRSGRNLDTYVATVVAAVFTALGIVGDIVPDNLKWSAVFAGLGMLLYRVTMPARPATPVEELLADRAALEATPFPSQLTGAETLWIFAPSAINILSPQTCEAIRRHVLDKGTGCVRVAVLDPSNADAVALATRQLDESLQYPVQDFGTSLRTSIEQLQKMAAWTTPGSFSYGLVDYNPGFSLVAIDPTRPDGRIVVEFHGYRNEAMGSRMHITLTRRDSDRWFQYWAGQFEEIWARSRRSRDPSGPRQAGVS